MTGARPADVTIRVQRTGERSYLEFTARRGCAGAFRVPIDQQRIAAAREQLDVGLTDIKDALPGLRADASDLDRVYSLLLKLGRLLRLALFGCNARIIQDLNDFWARALPFASNPAFPPLIEFASDFNGQLPVEFLMLSYRGQDAPLASASDLARACRAFLGFSCVVRRAILPVPLRGGLALDTAPDGRLPMRYLYFEGLEGAKEELAWLTTSAAHRVHIEGPYPCDARAPASLAEQIFDPGLELAGGRRAVPDQVQHFACHCYTGAVRELDNEIELRGNGADVRVTLGSLGVDLGDLADRLPRFAGDLPIVFMNACGSARLRATSAFSFPRFFLDHGNRGFIGTEVDMPDDFAAAFSTAFYQRFLIYGQTLGRSVLAARTDLLQKYGNPLGLAYTAYADPEVHINPAPAGRTGRDDGNVAAEP